MLNQSGEGTENTIEMPPKRNTTPTVKLNRNFLVKNPTIKAPINVPMAWAKKGAKKCMGSKNGIAFSRPSGEFKSNPDGGGMIFIMNSSMLILTIPPTIRPKIKEKIFFKISL
jgi:hypothetical protein